MSNASQLLNASVIDGDYLATTGAGTSSVNGSVVDMANFESVVFGAKFGTAASDNTIKVQQGDESNLSDASDLEGTSVTADGSAKYVLCEVFRPTKRYVRAVALRGTSSTLDGGFSIKHGPRTVPTTNTNAEIHVSPAEGTA